MDWRIFVALRYLTAKRKEKFISIISTISILGVAVGVAALIIVIAVMSGFDADLKDKITGTAAHIEITSDYGVAPSGELLKTILDTEHVVSASFFLNGQALIRHNENVSGIIIKGIDPAGEMRTSKINQYIKEGSLDLAKDGVIVGGELANKLNLKLGDLVSVITPAYVEGKGLRVRGIFRSGMYDYDMNLVYVSVAKAQEILAVNGLVSGLSVRIDDAFHIMKTRRVLQEKLGFPYIVRTWLDSNRNLLEALKLEKTVMFVILALIVMVACFNIASSLVMTVLEKTKDIGILKAIGSGRRDIMLIFAMEGSIIGIIGTMFGASFGIFICSILKKYKFITLPKDIYYIDKLPVRLELADISIIIVSSIIISILATIYPSYRASRLDPVEALRYE